MTLAYDPDPQDVLWRLPRRTPTVLLVDDPQHEYKRALAATLVGKRVGHGSQKAVAAVAGTSEATYRRWEDPDEPHMPDAWQIMRLAEHFGCEPAEILVPEELSPREWALTKRAAKAAARGASRALRGADEPS